jgi:hypothetical protein
MNDLANKSFKLYNNGIAIYEKGCGWEKLSFNYWPILKY